MVHTPATYNLFFQAHQSDVPLPGRPRSLQHSPGGSSLVVPWSLPTGQGSAGRRMSAHLPHLVSDPVWHTLVMNMWQNSGFQFDLTSAFLFLGCEITNQCVLLEIFNQSIIWPSRKLGRKRTEQEKGEMIWTKEVKGKKKSRNTYVKQKYK